MAITKLGKCECLACKHELNAASALDGESVPQEGDVTMCINCGYIMAFGPDQSLRKLNKQEQEFVENDSGMISLQRAFNQVKGY